ncbi:MAG: hypothetical protein M0P61_06375 [Ignavibacteriaceae bacterium]|jgi:hypothetical protein|nr:hypothetical protein [Ignavibacteriaceae bacterium]
MEKLIKYYCNKKEKLSKPRKSEVEYPYSATIPKQENNEEITMESRRKNGKMREKKRIENAKDC